MSGPRRWIPLETGFPREDFRFQASRSPSLEDDGYGAGEILPIGGVNARGAADRAPRIAVLHPWELSRDARRGSGA